MLPSAIPTVTVTAHYLSIDGHALTGTVTFEPPPLLTHSESDVMLGGIVSAPLDADGRINVTLPATDAPGMNPANWAYTVTEKLSGLPARAPYKILLPAARPKADLADIAPSDPGTPDYIPVAGLPGPPGPPGPAGAPGPVRSVNGRTEAEIRLTAKDVGALPVTGGTVTGTFTVRGAGDGPAVDVQDTTGASRVRIDSAGGLVATADARFTGNVQIGASVTDSAGGQAVLGIKNVTAVPTGKPTDGIVVYANGGVLAYRKPDGTTVTLDERAAGVRSVNGRSGVVDLTAADVRAEPAGRSVLLSGAQTVEGAKTFTTAPSTTTDPTAPEHLARKSYVDGVARANDWVPADLGFLAWTFDPGLGDGKSPINSSTPGDIPASGRIYYNAVVLRSAATVKEICTHTLGYSGASGGIGAGSFAGLYDAAGKRVAQTADLSMVYPEAHDIGGMTSFLPLSAPATLQPGIYVIALLLNYSNSANAPRIMTGNGGYDVPGRFGRPGTVPRTVMSPTKGNTALPTDVDWAGGTMALGTRYWFALA
ncbi:phage tail protein [Streptomyces sp. UNOB3_S3]|uniref:phage tail protein n=1 Tax=Streptomyces sp. UNOB3_S3 TaxID=2871682 RepID=UPI001E375A1B|nr:phage tail protein [Streptomyces sp. UNOB3_S3]MCC3776631.1 phage tail protein [Streptomyces sp. UNOB3_S3]